MIKTEFYRERFDGVKLYKTYSDENKYIQQVQTGRKYTEAIDIENSGYTYIETDEDIEVKNPDEEIKPE